MTLLDANPRSIALGGETPPALPVFRKKSTCDYTPVSYRAPYSTTSRILGCACEAAYLRGEPVAKCPARALQF